MEDLKMTVSRSYSRKVNLGNYETEDHWASYSMELPQPASSELVTSTSETLFELAKKDVEAQLPKGDGVDEALFADMLVRLANQGTVTIEEFESLNQNQLARIQQVKKAYKRRDYKNSKEVK